MSTVRITKSLRLVGVGPGAIVVDGGGTGTALTVSPGASVVISGTLIQHGFSATAGGGIVNGGTLTLINVTVANNSVTAASNTAVSGAGIENTGTLTLKGTTVGNNTLSGGTNGLGAAANGAGIDNSGRLIADHSAIRNNVATAGFSVYCNTCDGGSASGGGISNADSLTLANVTVGNNTAAQAGGISAVASITRLQNSIVAQNTGTMTGSGASPDCEGVISSGGYNVVGDGANCSGLTNGVNGDQVGSATAPLDARLAALGYYGGPTRTQALLAGSPAINTGNPAGCAGPSGALLATDQRGLPRPAPTGSRCDAGAFERQQG